MIIGLHGPQGSGKDVIAKGLAHLFDLECRRFAEKLYKMAEAFDPAFHPLMAHSEKEAYVLGDPKLGTRRNFLEKLGTEFMRDTIHEDAWVEGLMSSLNGWPTVIADVRMENEADAIRKAGGMIIHLIPDWTDYGGQHSTDFPLRKQSGDFLLRLVEGEIDEGIQKAGNFVVHHYSN